MRAAWLGLCVVVGCAPSRPSADCDPATPGCALPDGAVIADATIGPDRLPDAAQRHFGDPCTDGAQCESDICILVGTGGVCTQLCGECPAGYGCFGVLGVIDPEQVSFVCVPTSSQLCSPCQADSECTLLGMDRCLTEPTGRRYCGRDCSSVACPSGYDCADQVINNVNYKECVPRSNACDCNSASQQGATDACTITTALGTSCGGASTCNGTAGWGACLPPSPTDDPDGTFTDDNCDGIDGDLTRGIFVAGGGADTAGCGLTFATPCQTISRGIVRAVQAGKQNVYVQAGTYNEVLVLLNGVNVWGGYDFTWRRGPHGNPANRVTVIGKQDTTTGGDGEYLTVRAHDLIVPVTLGDLVLQGPVAQGLGGAAGGDGRSSYVVHARAASVALVRVQLVGGSGAPGATGGAGSDAVTVDAQGFMTGGLGGNGDQFSSTCNDSSRGAGGGVGVNSCTGSPSSRPTNGGIGGRGGTMDSDCSFPPSFGATSGANGSGAAFTQGGFGLPGPGGSGGSSCGATGTGNAGVIANGVGGGGNAGGYLGGVNGAYWYARSGNPGGTGENGSGGGGGGGGGGCDSGTDAFGAGGGGGAAGGCAARGGGGGGGGGGGAFGVAAVASSTVTLDSCDLFRGIGGGGGGGGTGGRGQSGGAGGQGGLLHPGSATPGNGGTGAHGGHGGGGGGGQGGRSVGILSTPDSTIMGTCAQSQGTSGSGGAGGASAPTAPAAERDGRSGSPGSAGALEDTRQCTNPTSC